jgi:hypothetical protein
MENTPPCAGIAAGRVSSVRIRGTAAPKPVAVSISYKMVVRNDRSGWNDDRAENGLQSATEPCLAEHEVNTKLR